jgi:hypothetical protein
MRSNFFPAKISLSKITKKNGGIFTLQIKEIQKYISTADSRIET